MENQVNLMKAKYVHAQKNRLNNLIDVLANLAEKAYVDGLLSLEDIIPYLQQPLLRKGIEKMVDAWYEQELESFLTHYIQTTDLAELELQENLIIKEGLLLILRGDRGSSISEKLHAMLKENFFQDIDSSFLE